MVIQTDRGRIWRLSNFREAYLESEKRFQSLFEINHLAILIIDPLNGSIVEANSAACSFYGYTRDILTTKNISDINVLSPNEISKKMQEAQKGQKKVFNFPHRLASGEIRFVEVHSSPIVYAGREMLYSMIHDITELQWDVIEKKKLEKEVGQKDAYFRQLFDYSPLAIAILDNTGRFMDVNSAFTKLFQFQAQEIQGHLLSQQIAKGMAGAKSNIAMLRQGQYIREETVRRRKDGTLVNVAVLGFPIFVDNKQTGMYAIYEDITDRKRAERILQESEERYRKLVENSPDGIIVHHHGRILFVNTVALQIVGAKSKEEMLQKSIYDYICPEHRGLALNRVRQIKEEGNSPSLVEYRLLRADASIVEVEARGTQLIFAGETSIQTTIREITERKRELYRASSFQKHRLETTFPLEAAAKLEMIYLPLQVISGDFYHFHKVDESKVVGILGDVAGKGITAALSISGLKVLFYEIASQTSEPLAILSYLNKEVTRHFDNDYVAATCFTFDFTKRILTITSAGINTYSHYQKGIYCVEDTLKGSYLGMFEDSSFETKEIAFCPGDRFYFYTDGLVEVIGANLLTQKWVKKSTITEQRMYLEKQLKKPQNLIDDATWLSIEINNA